MPMELDAYLQRIGYAGAPSTDLATLRALHVAHVSAIPFENIDVQAGVPIRLDLPSLLAKMVHRRRGGYCFEHNALFMAALETIGFSVRGCEARVRQGGAGMVRPRTHMVLIVTMDGREWLADVGFGGDGLVEPLALDNAAHEQGGRTNRVIEEGRLRVFQLQRGEAWEDLYAFLTEAVHPIDFVVANWFTSTFPESPFVRTLTAQRSTPEARHVLRNLIYSTEHGGLIETRALARDEVVPLLRDTFGLDLPDDVPLPALDAAGVFK